MWQVSKRNWHWIWDSPHLTSTTQRCPIQLLLPLQTYFSLEQMKAVEITEGPVCLIDFGFDLHCLPDCEGCTAIAVVWFSSASHFWGDHPVFPTYLILAHSVGGVGAHKLGPFQVELSWKVQMHIWHTPSPQLAHPLQDVYSVEVGLQTTALPQTACANCCCRQQPSGSSCRCSYMHLIKLIPHQIVLYK